MRKIIFSLMAAAMWAHSAYSQNTLKATVKEEGSGETLIGVTAKVKGTDITAVSDVGGNITVSNIPDGKHTIVFSYNRL